MQTLSPANKASRLPMDYKEGDFVRLSRDGLCKVIEVSKRGLTLLTSTGVVLEAFVALSKETKNVQRNN